MRSDAQPRVLALELAGGRRRYACWAAQGTSRQGDADRGFTFGGSGAARSDVADAVVPAGRGHR